MKTKQSQGAATAADALPTTNEGVVPPSKEPGKSVRILNNVINVVLVVAIILAAVCTYVSYVSTSGNGVPSILGIRVLSIQTDSMYPVMSAGDLIFATGVDDASELEIGDIITYWTVIEGERVLNTHRITEIYDGGGYLIFSTKGDSNTAEDALTVHESEIVGKYVSKVTGVGKVFDYLQTSTGFLLIVVIPVFLFFIFHLVQFFHVLFEYQNVKNRIKYEQERGRTEEILAAERLKLEQVKEEQKQRLAEELKAQMRAELLAEMQNEAVAAQEPQPEDVATTEEKQTNESL